MKVKYGILLGIFVGSLLVFSGCGDGGGGVSVGRPVAPPTVIAAEPVTSVVYLTLAPKTLAQSAAPKFAPFAAMAAFPVSAVSRVDVGISKIRLEVSDDCSKGERTEFEREGNYVLSLTDGVIRPEPAPIEVSRNTELCQLKIEWSGGKWEEDQKSKIPPSIVIEGWLSDGRPLQLATSRVKEFNIKPGGADIPITTDVVEIELNFPYRNWLVHLDPLSLESSSDGVVRINDDDNDEFLDGVELKFDEGGGLEKKDECKFSETDSENTDPAVKVCDKKKEHPNQDKGEGK